VLICALHLIFGFGVSVEMFCQAVATSFV